MTDPRFAGRLVLPAGLGPVDQDPDVVRQDACELLSPQVECDPPTPQLGSDSGVGGAGDSVLGPIAWLLLAVLVAVLMGVAVRALAGRVRDRHPDDDAAERADGEEIQPLAEALIDPDHSPADWRARSQRHRAVGELRDALRCEYRALVGDLARRNLIDEIPGRTTGEERVQLRRTAPMVTATFGAAADMFDAVWYGAADATVTMVTRFDDLEREVLAATATAAARTRRAADVS